MLTGIAIAFFITSQTIDPIFPLYVTTELGASTFELGLIISLFSLTAVITKIPMGILAEKIGKWLIIPISLFGQVICIFLYSIAPNPSWLYPIRIFHSLISAAFFPVVVSIIFDLSPPNKRGDRLGIFLTSYGLATMIGPFLGSIILSYVDYRQLLQLIVLIPLLTGLLFLFAKYKGIYKVYVIKTDQIADKEVKSHSIKDFIISRNIIILLIVRVSYHCTGAFFITFFAVYAFDDLSFTLPLISILFGIRGVTNTLSRIPSGKLTDRIESKFLIIIALSLTSFVYFIASETTSLYILILVMALYGTGHGMRAVAEWKILADSTSPTIRATASAIFETMYNMGDALGAILAGILSLVLPIPVIFKIGSIILLPAIVVVAFIKENTEENSF